MIKLNLNKSLIVMDFIWFLSYFISLVYIKYLTFKKLPLGMAIVKLCKVGNYFFVNCLHIAMFGDLSKRHFNFTIF